MPPGWQYLVTGSNELWQFSISGLSTLLLLVIFLALTLCLTRLEAFARAGTPDHRRLVRLALAAGALTGLGLLTRYAFGWIIIPVWLCLWLFGGLRRRQLAGLAGGMGALIVAPWLVRNYLTSGELFGRAGYAVLEGTSLFPGMTLMQTSSPAMAGAVVHGGWISPIFHKLAHNAVATFQYDLPHLGGWAAMLFFAGPDAGIPQSGSAPTALFRINLPGRFRSGSSPRTHLAFRHDAGGVIRKTSSSCSHRS